MDAELVATPYCVVSDWTFRAIWGAILFVYMPRHTPRIVAIAELYSLTVDRRFFPLIAAGYAVVASVHAGSLLEILVASLRSRSLRFSGSTSSTTSSSSRPPATASPGSRAKFWALRWLPGRASTPECRASSFSRVHSYTASVRVLVSAWSVTDPHYDTAHVVREVVETVLLSLQAHKASYLVAVPWMNHALAALLVLNCWSTPLIRRAFGRSRVFTARLLSLAVGVALGAVSFGVIPVALFLPYAADFDPALASFANRFWYTDRWLVGILNEWRMLFVTSLWDGVSRFLIAATLARSLRAMPSLLLRRRPRPRSRAKLHPQPQTQTQPQPQPLGPSPSVLGLKPTPAALPPPRATRLDRLGRGLLTLWGAVVVAVHLHAASHGANELCMTQVRPWFARRAACSLMEINCARDNGAHVGDGRAADFDRAMASVDRQWVAFLIVRHCAHVELTPTFRELRNLQGVKLYNATLARWDADAALTQQHHPHAMLVFLVATNMTALPRGLLARDFPRRLMDIEICRSNLSTLPDAVADAWPRDLFLLLEDLQLAAVPDVVARLQPSSLSLAMNAFSTLPAALLEGPSLSWLQLNGNPLAALPADVRVASPLQFLFLDGTRVAALPPWLDLSRVFRIQAAGTPLCDALRRDNRSHALLSGVVRCPEAAADRRYLYNFPLADEERNNP
ncbi:hypothetical protein ATCC90586_003927 [Pythium insidiosum]|nr:hypothetical protein ATCC90586_003927 [Pythium insidiosum]